MINISSSQNPLIKEIKALKDRKHREEKKLFFIEGIRFVEEAFKEKAPIVKLLVSQNIEEIKGGSQLLECAKVQGTDVCVLPDKLFKELSDTQSPQGIMAVVSFTGHSLEDILGQDNFLILLDSIQDPGNMGTIIRTADAAGATAIIASKGCVDIYNPKVLRSTMGSIFHIPVCISESLVDTIDMIKSMGVKICAAHLMGGADYFHVDMKKNTAIIIGNEANGISDEVAKKADLLVKIPMPGRAESLNASVAAGLLMYEAVRQRNMDEV